MSKTNQAALHDFSLTMQSNHERVSQKHMLIQVSTGSHVLEVCSPPL